MRMLYLILGMFVLLNIGAVCRTAQPLPDNCAAVSSGLVYCPSEQVWAGG